MANELTNQKGIALGYVYGLVALLAILGALLVQGGVKQGAVEEKRLTDTLVAQAHLIRNAIFLCRISYPGGGASGGFDNAFPATTSNLRNSECPGASGLKVFGGVSEVAYPRQPEGFSAWALTNDASGISISTQIVTPQDRHHQAAIVLAADELGEWQTAVAGDTLTYFIK